MKPLSVMDTEYFAPSADIWDYHQDGDVVQTQTGTFQNKVFQQSVTLTAKMWPQENSTTGDKWEWGSWRVPAQHWPLLVGMFCGGALVLLLIVTAILWRCCVAPHRNKDYRVKMGDIEAIQQRTVVPVLPSHSAVYLDPKCSQWSYNSRLVTSECGHWFYNKHVLSAATLERCTVPRSVSVPAHQDHGDGSRPPRPHSQPVSLPTTTNTRVIFPDSGPCSLPLPQISEFSPGTQYASSSILDECGSRRDIFAPSIGGTILKTQSLPACVRSKTRPLSTADDPAELYAKLYSLTAYEDGENATNQNHDGSKTFFDALETVLKWAETEDQIDCIQIMKLKRLQSLAARKRGIALKQTVIDNSSKKCKSMVNFSKKRKNRMRNDEAAIIALSKSQSQFLHRDTDCLVDNEAVIVYDERTAL